VNHPYTCTKETMQLVRITLALSVELQLRQPTKLLFDLRQRFIIPLKIQLGWTAPRKVA